MAKLTGLKVGDVITQFIGPITGRNRFDTTVAPSVIVRVVGTGSVMVQETQSFNIVGIQGALNPYSKEKRPHTFVNIGLAITEASGNASRALTADAVYSAVQVVVTGVGDGYVTIETNWR